MLQLTWTKLYPEMLSPPPGRPPVYFLSHSSQSLGFPSGKWGHKSPSSSHLSAQAGLPTCLPSHVSPMVKDSEMRRASMTQETEGALWLSSNEP